MPGSPRLSVVVASHARRTRLRWLLNALEEQTLPAHEWELVVVHDYDPATAAEVLDAHPLARGGRLRHIAIAPGTGSPARQRNIGWRGAHGGLVVFTDDDCRPEPDWLAELAAAAEAHPGAVVQGRTRPDPYERDVFAAPHVRTLDVEPPGRFAQTCNILYPRALLERLGGFDEVAVTGEDVDLALRARAAGVPLVPAPAAVANHAIEAWTLAGAVRGTWKWRYLVHLVKKHPELRRELVLGLFWEREHVEVLLAVAGVIGARRRPLLAALALPYVRREGSRRGPRPLDRLVAAAELPGRAVAELADVAAMAAGSVRFRTPVL